MMQILFTIGTVLLLGCKSQLTTHNAVGFKDISEVENSADNGTEINSKGVWISDPANGLKYNSATSDLNSKNHLGRTPFHFAAFEGNDEFIKNFVSRGAKINVVDDFGRTPLDYTDKKHRNTRDLFRKYGGKTSEELIPRLNTKHFKPKISIHIAAMEGNLDVLKEHLKYGSYVDLRDDYERTPLHIAAKYGYKNIVLFLIKNGANVNARDRSWQMPAMVAKNKEISKIIMDNGGRYDFPGG